MIRHHAKPKYICTIVISITVLLFTFYNLGEYNKVNAQSKIIKVAYPIVEGFTELEDGVYSGYAYEYLREIAKFTGWKYEFVEASLNDSIQMLINGEVDIAGSVLKNSSTEKYFDFPENDAGSIYTTLAVLRSNTKISDSNYESLNGIKVGVFETSQDSIDKFEIFCKDNNIKDVEVIKYQPIDDDDLNNALSKGEVDAILGNDLLMESDQRIALRFSPTPHYFATTDGNTEILSQLNYAMARIKELEPYYNENLYRKYFSKDMTYTLSLTTEESDYINSLGKLRAVYIDNLIPSQDYNENTKQVEGISIDVMEKIGNDLGVEIEWVKAKDYEEAFTIVSNGDADVFPANPNEYNITDRFGISITKPYMNLHSGGVGNKNKTPEEYKTIAIPKSYKCKNKLPLDNHFNKILMYDTIEECIQAVDNGTADFTFGSIYKISSETQTNYYKNINLTYDPTNTGEVAIGIGDHCNLELLSIINKAILSIKTSELDDILYNNIVNIKGKVTLESFIRSNSYWVIAIIVIISVIIITLLYIILKLRLDNARYVNKVLKEKAENDPLTGVYNRESVEKLINKHLTDKADDVFSTFLIIDIDNFKAVNDKLGHMAGDNVIKELSTNLKSIFRSEDIVGRLGGDEFEVFMRGIDESSIDTVHSKVQMLCKSMDKNITSDNGLSIPISLSVGVCIFKRNTTFCELYEEADNVLYDVKRNGRNNYKVKIID